MHSMIGPPPRAYTGPYPTLEQCQAVLNQQGQPQSEKLLDNGVIEMAAKRFTVPVEEIRYWGFVVTEPDPAPVTAALFQSRCLVVRVPRDRNPSLATIKLFDATSGRAFAVYWDKRNCANAP